MCENVRSEFVGSLARDVTVTDVDEHQYASANTQAVCQAFEDELSDDVETGLETGIRNPKRACQRGFAVFLVVAAFVAVLTHTVTFHKRRASVRASAPNVNSFVNYVRAPGRAHVAPWIKPKPELCNVGVVLDMCLRLNKKGPEYLGFEAHSPKAVVSASTLSEYFMASKESVLSYLTTITAVNVSTDSDDFIVNCEQLCQKTVASFGMGELPPMVDVGCYYQGPSVSPTCAVDLGLSVLKHTGIPDGSAAWSEQFLYDSHQRLTEEEERAEKVLDALGSKPGLTALDFPAVPYEQLQLAAARLFRIFPGSKKVSLDINPLGVTTRRLWDDSCKTANDGHCDVPDSCEDGTDCTDCGTCQGRLPQDTCQYANDDFCDEPRYCMVGTDCTDCDECGWGGEDLYEKLKKTKPNDSCETAQSGTCDDSCEEGTDCTDCNSCLESGYHYQPAQWDYLVLQTGSKVQGLLAAALIGLQSGAGGDILMDLIGKDDDRIRTELKRIITGLSRMLDNVDYIFPGAKCKASTYGYSEVDKPPAAGEQYKINLCQSFMEGNPYECLVTLMETGIQGSPMLAETAVLDGQPVFDLAMVKKLAKVCQVSGGDACAKSVRNAQSILYVIVGFV